MIEDDPEPLIEEDGTLVRPALLTGGELRQYQIEGLNWLKVCSFTIKKKFQIASQKMITVIILTSASHAGANTRLQLLLENSKSKMGHNCVKKI